MTAMSWQPQEEPLRQLSRCLKDSLSGQNQKQRKEAEDLLKQANQSPDINNYLTYIFSSGQVPSYLNFSPDEYHGVRSAAAIMLKNNIRESYKSIPQASLELIRSSVPLALEDENGSIRSYAGNVITEIVTRGGILDWPQILPELLAMVGNESGTVKPQAQEGAMAALAKICEDNKKLLDKDYQGQRPLSFIIPKLVQFSLNGNPRIRTLALSTINVFIPLKSQSLLVSLDDLLNGLFQLANDPSSEVRRQVCRAFVQLVEIRPDKILPHISGLVDYIISQQRKIDDEGLACDAAEFWLTVGEHDELWQSLGPYLGKIIPVLLESMVYGEDDIAILQGARDDADEEDRAEDIKPQFAKSKGARAIASETEEGAGKNGGYTKLDGVADEDFEEGEIDEENSDDDENPEQQWTLRKCSAAALDVFATDFRGPVFDTILPYLMKNLRHQEWQYREAAVLALGAVAEGCMDVVVPHLPDLVPYLITLLNDQEPLVRQITCWTLGRYSGWGANLTEPGARAQYFVPMMEGILTKMLDSNKKVQEAGASAFAHLEEKAGTALIPYCEPILQQFVLCFNKYKDRNMFILYDCVQTLAENIGKGLSEPRLTAILMPALIDRWQKVTDQSRELFPLLECLSYVATALGEAFAPYAIPIFTRCIKLVHQNLEECLAAVNNPILDRPDKDFLVTSLDLLSAIIQALEGKQSAALVSGSQPQLFELLAFCMEDPENDVRQSSYALLGDCAKYVFPQLQPFLPTLLPILTRQLDLDSILDEQIETGFSVLNNACWSAVIENAAIALGRLGLGNDELLAPALATFSHQFLTSIATVEYTSEKATAFQGFLSIVNRNPQAMEKDLGRLFTAIARYRLTEELQQMFQHILNLYATLIPNFASFLPTIVSEVDLANLRSKFQLPK
ncbi:hypothetical protein B7463_g591, partial [Scytalidium lignicola]